MCVCGADRQIDRQKEGNKQSNLTPSHHRGLNFCTICDSLLNNTCYTRPVMKFEHFKGCHLCVDTGVGLRCQWRGGGYWLLQASREEDRWLDTGQNYTAKGCKRSMGKPCVCH